MLAEFRAGRLSVKQQMVHPALSIGASSSECIDQGEDWAARSVVVECHGKFLESSNTIIIIIIIIIITLNLISPTSYQVAVFW
jgi:flagellar biosynthesis component FlhA